VEVDDMGDNVAAVLQILLVVAVLLILLRR
jgi:hypothetical protein